MKVSSDDPMLTAYALGELDEVQRAVVEQLLKQDPNIVEEVESIRATARLLSEQLVHEPMPKLTNAQQARILAMAVPARQARRFPLPRWAAIAALFALVPAGLFCVLSRSKPADVRVAQKTGSHVTSQAVDTTPPQKPARPQNDQPLPAPSTDKVLKDGLPTSQTEEMAPLKIVVPQPVTVKEPKPTSPNKPSPEPKHEEMEPPKIVTPKSVSLEEPRAPQPDTVSPMPQDGKLQPIKTETPKPVSTGEPADETPERPPRMPGHERLEPLKIKLPKPMFVGTPKSIKSDNLEPQTGRKREPFMAPKGLTNVAAGMAVTASESAPIIGDLSMITDGDKEGADGSFVEFGPGTQWVQVDLGARQEIFAIVVWHFHSQARIYRDLVVRVSNDADFVKGVSEVFNNDHDNSSGLGVGQDKEYIETNEGRLIDAKGVKGRYVRLYSNGNTSNDMNHYIEVEVYGRPSS